MWWGLRVPCGDKSLHEGKGSLQEVRQTRVQGAKGGGTGCGMRVYSSRKCSETDLLREKGKHRDAGLWVHAKECRLQLAPGD